MGRRAKDKHSILIGGIARVYYDDDTKYDRRNEMTLNVNEIKEGNTWD